MAVQDLMSVDEFSALPNHADDYRDELIAGRLAGRPPRTAEQGRVGSRIQMGLHRLLGDGAGEVVGYAGYLLAVSPDTVRAPDIAVVTDYDSRTSASAGYLVGAPQLAVADCFPSPS